MCEFCEDCWVYVSDGVEYEQVDVWLDFVAEFFEYEVLVLYFGCEVCCLEDLFVVLGKCCFVQFVVFGEKVVKIFCCYGEKVVKLVLCQVIFIGVVVVMYLFVDEGEIFVFDDFEFL